MAEYIEREAAIDAIESTDWYHQNKNKDMVHGANSAEHQAWYRAQDIYAAINYVPAADVQPVRHGRWIKHYEPYDTGEECIEAPYGFECSECGRWEAEQEPFCNCGAKMDGGKE